MSEDQAPELPEISQNSEDDVEVVAHTEPDGEIGCIINNSNAL